NTLSLHLLINPSHICPAFNQSINQSINCLIVCLSPSNHPLSIYPSIYLSIHPSIYPSISPVLPKSYLALNPLHSNPLIPCPECLVLLPCPECPKQIHAHAHALTCLALNLVYFSQNVYLIYFSQNTHF